MKDFVERLNQFFPDFETIEVPRRTVVLKEGEISDEIYFVKKGVVRLWFNNDGKDVTFQFFFPGKGVSSIESFLEKKASLFNIETITPCELIVIKQNDYLSAMDQSEELRNYVFKQIYHRLYHYQSLFLSRIKDTPAQRYEKLIAEFPEIIQQVPQHYIASYLGITAVSLSRIRNKGLI
ncbi:Crp/Fnr family transcriptional regulator [Prolixibacteraceae bacterium JC049]|nr:Crp/Fnr family transcriptional regulator [Prolixibacteraceae bacterium JC049]